MNLHLYTTNNTMNLIEQFPDISMKIREKARMRLNKGTVQVLPAAIPYHAERDRSNLYDRAFRKWHFKLLMIIIALLGGIYLIILQSPWMFNRVNL